MGNINCFIPTELPVMVFDSLEFPDLHNLYCTSTNISQLITEKRLIQAYNTYYPFKFVEWTDEERKYHEEHDVEERNGKMTDVVHNGVVIGFTSYVKPVTFPNSEELVMRKAYNAYIHLNHFFDKELLDKLNYNILDKAFRDIYDKIKIRWKNKICYTNGFTYYNNGVAGWDHLHYEDQIRYTPKISVENEVKFMYEVFRIFRYKIEKLIELKLKKNNTT